MADDNPPGNPPVPLCPVCNNRHFPSAPCPGRPGEEETPPPEG